MKLNKNDTILFVGDSITDCGRSFEDNNKIGNGYVSMIANSLNATYPHLNINIINKGISGNRVVDLVGRWDTDCLNIKPELLSILIGVNDTWRRYDSNMITLAEDYYRNLKKLLEQVKTKLPSTKIILLEPFLLPINKDIEIFYEDLDDKIKKVRKLAVEFETVYIPLDGLFAQVSTIRKPKFWSNDGVHPTSAGHMLIAQSWMNAIIKD